MSASRLTGRRRFGHCNDAHGNEILTTGAARPPAQRSAVQLMGIGCVNDARQSAGIQRPATGFSTTGAPITRVPITTVASGSSDEARRGTSPHEGNGLHGPRCLAFTRFDQQLGARRPSHSQLRQTQPLPIDRVLRKSEVPTTQSTVATSQLAANVQLSASSHLRPVDIDFRADSAKVFLLFGQIGLHCGAVGLGQPEAGLAGAGSSGVMGYFARSTVR